MFFRNILREIELIFFNQFDFFKNRMLNRLRAVGRRQLVRRLGRLAPMTLPKTLSALRGGMGLSIFTFCGVRERFRDYMLLGVLCQVR